MRYAGEVAYAVHAACLLSFEYFSLLAFRQHSEVARPTLQAHVTHSSHRTIMCMQVVTRAGSSQSRVAAILCQFRHAAHPCRTYKGFQKSICNCMDLKARQSMQNTHLEPSTLPSRSASRHNGMLLITDDGIL